jgi:hypothetical protein
LEFDDETDERGNTSSYLYSNSLELSILIKALTDHFPKPQTHFLQRILVVVELLSIPILVCWHSALMKNEWLGSAVNRSRAIQRSINGSSNYNPTSA